MWRDLARLFLRHVEKADANFMLCNSEDFFFEENTYQFSTWISCLFQNLFRLGLRWDVFPHKKWSNNTIYYVINAKDYGKLYNYFLHWSFRWKKLIRICNGGGVVLANEKSLMHKNEISSMIFVQILIYYWYSKISELFFLHKCRKKSS